MPGPEFAIAIILLLIVLVSLGLHIVVALGLSSFLGIAYLTGDFNIAVTLLSNTAYSGIRDYVFAVVPLFILMGEFVSRSGLASDLYSLANRSLKRLPGRLALATVGGNAVFGAVTGVSVASAAAFSRIAYPQMVAHGYNKSVALGAIAGSSALGMIIPPSVLMIVWGVIAGESIGRLFIAGIVPGLLLALMFATFLVILAVAVPRFFGGKGREAAASAASSTPLPHPAELTLEEGRSEMRGALGIVLLIVVVLGGIWAGVFTPTEAAGIGALIALGLGILKGMRFNDVLEAIIEAGKISAPILFLLISAQMYSRLLAFGGIIDVINSAFQWIGVDPLTLLMVMVIIWVVAGMFIDSVSIILLTVPIFAPIATSAGWDPIAFAIMGILAIEAGLLTPPFGLCVYTVRSAIDDKDVRLYDIFVGSAPYCIMLLLLVAIIAVFPSIATFLVTQMM